MRFAALGAAALALVCLSLPAEARPRQIVAHPDCNVTMPCEGVAPSPRGEQIARAVGFGVAQKVYTPRGEVIGGRPAGCPHRFCGCGASLHLFGKIIPRLNLAANWLRFPRAAPAPNMAAARRGHVMVLKRHLHGSVWLVHDSNSGGGKTRLHARSIAGFVIVDPSGAV
ncbi:hypothetical protein [Afipia carboxidovorans]|uniref:hypothetical protein n=1 Tax=Afipia carboxidovorans TaxID=40137 RepID=UPI00308AB030|nr:hypothetical protein CRBSH125_21930 [Afipia carboxidovorans]